MFKNALDVIPGGVNSPVRSFNAVDSSPIYIKRGKGAYLYDEDKNKYIDYINSFGPLIFGHSKKEISNAAIKAMDKGTTFGACHKNEIKLAELIKEKMPSMEMTRLTSSGTEATMSAIRLARAYTKKDKIIKFEGCYHGHVDHLLVKAGSGLTTFGSPSSPGVPRDFTKHTLIAEFNNLTQVEKLFKKNKNKIAAIILEPVPANMGVILPKSGFLKKILDLAHCNDSLVIFDEVISGFRLSIGGAQEYYNLKPDITCIGKIIGGGFPIGAFGGKKEIMSILSPSGPVYQAGTLSGNPIAVAAGIKTIELLEKNNLTLYTKLEKRALNIKTEIDKLNLESITINQIGSLLTFFITKNKSVVSYKDVLKCDTKIYGALFKKLLLTGIMVPPSQFEAMFISDSHSKNDIIETIESFKKGIKTLGLK
ncbi:glutamate-1-semialdehyde 2,1-aminomutase [bacterium]|nr:glutamate-1-semialdehyde 2,1-aminomutase [bacterium]MBT3794980.1 glutamate-1-semialdehyde 2,1-aminomutase [bacterium]MBT4634631.1 glutamate-1-semialdehyde 2,1-aminomutase [bacterium]